MKKQDYYLDRWEESTNVSELLFGLEDLKPAGDIESAIDSYLDAIKRFGNDINQVEVDKIINELEYLSIKIIG